MRKALEINREYYNEHIVENKELAIVEYWAPWCVYCRRIGPAYDKLAGERDDLIIAKVNIDDEPQLAADNGIEVIPSIVLYKNGEAVASLVAPESKAKINDLINEHI